MSKQIQNMHFPVLADTHRQIRELAQFEDRSMRSFLSRFLAAEIAKAHARMEAKKAASGMMEGSVDND